MFDILALQNPEDYLLEAATTAESMTEVELRQKVDELCQSNRRFVNILEGITDGFIVLNHLDQFTYLNQQAELFLQRRREELIGKSAQEVFLDTSGITFLQDIFKARHPRNLAEFELYYEPLSSWFEVRIYPYQGGLSIYLRDVSARRRADEEMWKILEKEKELSELKSRFVSIASHEFRTPLSTILATTELLENYSDRWSEDKKQQFFQRIYLAVERMTGLLNDVLLISKADAGKLGFNPAPLELTAFCRDLLSEFQSSQKGACIFNLISKVSPLEGWVDEKLLRHILFNLVSNAVKYSPQAGIVTLRLAYQTGNLIIQVEDNGIGIPAEDIPRLFEVFHRAKNVNNIQGTGLGLSIVKRSVDLHGGAILIESELGVGTTFTVTLPANE